MKKESLILAVALTFTIALYALCLQEYKEIRQLVRTNQEAISTLLRAESDSNVIEYAIKEPVKPQLISLEEYEQKRPKFESVTELQCGIACPECGEELYEDYTFSLTTNPPMYYINCKACGWSGTKH